MPTILRAAADSDLEVCPEMVTQAAILPQAVDTKVNNSSANEMPACETSGEAEKLPLSEESVLQVAKTQDEDAVQPEAVNVKSEEAGSPKVSLQEDETSDKEEHSQKSPEHEEHSKKNNIEEKLVHAVEGNEVNNEMALVADEPSEVRALEQPFEESSTREQPVELDELPLEQPKKSEEKSVDVVPEKQDEPDKG